MHVKRNVGATEVPAPVIASPVTTTPIPAEPVKKSSSDVSPPSAPKPSSEKAAPFMNVTFGKSSKIEALEASGSSGYVLVSSPTVSCWHFLLSIFVVCASHVNFSGWLLPKGKNG